MKAMSVKVEIVDTSPNSPIAIMPLRISLGRGSRDSFEFAVAIAKDWCEGTAKTENEAFTNGQVTLLDRNKVE